MIASGGSYYKIANGSIDFAGLPSEYQQVEYIENSGTQYIDTNFYPNYDNGFEIIIEYSPTNLNTRGCLLSNYINNKHISFEINVAGQQRLFYLNGTVDRVNNNVLTTKNIGVFKFYNETFYNILNNVSREDNYNVNGYCDSSLYMFVDRMKRFSVFTNYLKIYKCSIKDNNTLVRNFIPCYRISDNEIGMYDTVNDVFYTNQGTGTFLKGNNVVHTIRYKIPCEQTVYHIRGTATADFDFTLKYIDRNNNITTVTESAVVDENGNFDVVYYGKNIYSLVNTFRNNTYIDEIQITEHCNNVISLENAFASCTFMRVDFPNGEFKNTTILTGFVRFNNRVDKKGVIRFPKATFEKVTDASYFIQNSSAIEEIYLNSASFNSLSSNTHMFTILGSLKDLYVPNNNSMSLSVSFQNSPLTYDSMLRVAGWLKDLSGGTAQTVTFRKATYDALTAEQQATLEAIIVTQKGWNLATA